MRSAFQSTGPGNHGKRQAVTKLNFADSDNRVGFCGHCFIERWDRPRRAAQASVILARKTRSAEASGYAHSE
jgi:hypothetical protein